MSNSSRVRNGLVVAQVALSIVLVIGAGVFVRALQKSTSIEPGFEPSGVELASLDLSLANYTAVSGQLFLRELTTRVREIPTVQDASAAASLPTGGPSRYGFLSHPEAQSSRGERLPADWNVVQPRYFSTMRIPLVAGRDFSDADREGTQRVMIVNEEAARRYWPGQNPIGKVLMQNLAEVRRNQDNSPKAVEVIGVVGNVTARLRESARPQVYLPLQQQFVPNIMIAARTVDGQRVAGPIRQVVTSMNGTLPILSVQTLEEAVAFALLPQRLGATVSGSLGIVGLLLATMGIYGVTAFAVAQRTREIGIRVALGATRSAVVTMVLRFGMSLVAIGTVCGLLLAWMLNTVLTSALSGFPPMDALPFLGSAVLFVLVGLTACLTPMRRATRIDPLVVLRDE